jgi:hypothetical protein
LNYLALNSRYNDDIEEVTTDNITFPQWDKASWQNGFWKMPKSRIQLFKTLQFFIYQCSEDKAIETPLYKALNNIKNDLMYTILSNTAEYESAIWG